MLAQRQFLDFRQEGIQHTRPLEGNYDLAFLMPLEWVLAGVCRRHVTYKEKMSQSTYDVTEASSADTRPKQRKADALLSFGLSNEFLYFENSIASTPASRQRHINEDHDKLMRYCVH